MWLLWLVKCEYNAINHALKIKIKFKKVNFSWSSQEPHTQQNQNIKTQSVNNTHTQTHMHARTYTHTHTQICVNAGGINKFLELDLYKFYQCYESVSITRWSAEFHQCYCQQSNTINYARKDSATVHSWLSLQKTTQNMSQENSVGALKQTQTYTCTLSHTHTHTHTHACTHARTHTHT